MITLPDGQELEFIQHHRTGVVHVVRPTAPRSDDNAVPISQASHRRPPARGTAAERSAVSILGELSHLIPGDAAVPC